MRVVPTGIKCSNKFWIRKRVKSQFSIVDRHNWGEFCELNVTNMGLVSEKKYFNLNVFVVDLVQVYLFFVN